MSRGRSAITALVVVLLVVACGGEEPAGEGVPTGGAGFPVEVRGVAIPGDPQRIASLSASHTEMLYAMGVGDRVVATDLFSDYPAEAQDSDKIDAFNLSVESVAAFDPDLVLVAFDPGGVVAGLEVLGIPTVLFDAPADLDDALAQMLEVGRAVGVPDRAAELVGQLRERVEAVVAGAPDSDGLTFYHELDGSLFTVTSDTFVGSLYELFGMVNIADAADATGSGYPQLSGEYLIESDPDVIFLADTKCCGIDAGVVASRPGWNTLSAVRDGRIVELDDDVASRWGPRLVEFLDAVASFLEGEYGP
jgi:iron complex transport system substrate-binding protein